MDATTATTGNLEPVRLETVLKAMEEISLLPKPDQWVVIDPHGRMYKGKVEDVTRVLMAEHPLLKTPLSLGAMWPNGDG